MIKNFIISLLMVLSPVTSPISDPDEPSHTMSVCAMAAHTDDREAV